MNYTLQLHGERFLYQMPPGLYELMSDISREVLRDQPTFLYQYIAHYLDTLVKVRDYAQTAEDVVSSTLDENLELLAYVDSLGTTWDTANSAATKIQNAARRYRSKKELKLKLENQKEKKAAAEFYLQSQAFQDYMETLNLDLDDSSRASSLLLNAYKEFNAEKEEVEEERSEASVHTIEAILPRVSEEVKKEPRKRDSKMLVYQQTPKHSVESTWSTLARKIAEEEGKWKPNEVRPYALVYEGDISVASKDQPAHTVTKCLPGYQDKDEPKVPMIAETGELSDDKDIVTLLSFDSVDQSYFKETGIHVDTSFSNLSLPSLPPEKSKELFDLLEKRYSEVSKLITPSPSLMKDEKLIKSQPVVEDRGSSSSIKRGSKSSVKSPSEHIRATEEGRGSRSSAKRESKSSAKSGPEQIKASDESPDPRSSSNRGSKSSAKSGLEQIRASKESHGSRSSIKKSSKSSGMAEPVHDQAPEEVRGSRTSTERRSKTSDKIESEEVKYTDEGHGLRSSATKETESK
ncbi:hypothetical protein J6590_009771 [Homalodisca vitripennis]|nr:hypothetical protein J6590_009771 [Homalodisca vitripennis]